MSRSNVPYGLTCPHTSGVRPRRSAGDVRAIQAGSDSTRCSISVFMYTRQELLAARRGSVLYSDVIGDLNNARRGGGAVLSQLAMEVARDLTAEHSASMANLRAVQFSLL